MLTLNKQFPYFESDNYVVTRSQDVTLHSFAFMFTFTSSYIFLDAGLGLLF